MQFDISALLFSLKKIVAALVLPPLAPLLLIVLGLVLLLLRRPRAGHTLAWLGVAATVFFSSGYTVNWLARTLEPPTPISAEALIRAQAIVVLGGGRRHYAPEYAGGETVNSRTLERMRYGALLARRSGLPVLVSGGNPTGNRPEATLMSEVMAQEFGVPVRWAEGASRDTRENARLAAEDLRAAGITRIALVTHAAHMRRPHAPRECGIRGAGSGSHPGADRLARQRRATGFRHHHPAQRRERQRRLVRLARMGRQPRLSAQPERNLPAPHTCTRAVSLQQVPGTLPPAALPFHLRAGARQHKKTAKRRFAKRRFSGVGASDSCGTQPHLARPIAGRNLRAPAAGR